MKKFESPNIVCSCVGNHRCGIMANAAVNDPLKNQDTIENMFSLDTDSNSSAATNADNETMRVAPPINEDSGIDTLLNADVPSVPSAFSSGNNSPDVDMLPLPSASASCGSDTSAGTEYSLSIGTSSGMVSTSTTASEHQSFAPSISVTFHSHDADASTENTGDKSTMVSLSVPQNTPTRTPKHESGASGTNTPGDSPAKTSPSRPTNLSSSLRRTYHEFSETAATDEGVLKSIAYVTADMVAKKKKTEQEANPKVKSTSSSSGTRSRSSSISQSIESRDTSFENLSGCSTDPLDDDDWYTRMRTHGPKVKVTGSVRPDGTIHETEEHRSSSSGGAFLTVNVPTGDICRNIYFGRKSPSLVGDGAPSKKDGNPQKSSDAEDSKDSKEKDKDNTEKDHEDGSHKDEVNKETE